jgi:hypothetical protein
MVIERLKFRVASGISELFIEYDRKDMDSISLAVPGISKEIRLGESIR